MRRFVGALFALAFSSSAYAADIPEALPPYRAPAVAPIFSWTGFYAGLSGGVGRCSNCDVTIKGGFAGGQVGYNWQAAPMFVVGLEADAFASWIGHTQTIGLVTLEMASKAFATARARAGLALGPTLIYGTGGYAWAQNEISLTAGALTLASKQTQSGPAVGGGIEYAFAPNWSVKAEYVYTMLGSANFFGVIRSGDLEIHTVKLGVNYLFR